MAFIPLLQSSRLWLATVLVALITIPMQTQARTEYVEGEVIVTFKASTTPNTADSALQKRGLQFYQRFPAISAIRRKPMGVVRRIGSNTQALIQELKTDPTVESVEPNYKRWISAVPNDTRFGDMWGLQNTGKMVGTLQGIAGADIKFVEAWAKARPSTEELVVAVIDTGVNYTHPELAPRMWKNTGETPNNKIDDDGNGYKDDYYGYNFSDDLPDPIDSGYHGTHVAGTVAAQGNNNEGVIGVNDRAKIMALRVSSDGDGITTSAVIEAVDYAVMMKQRGVPIVAINASYGGGGFSNTEKASINAAGAQGIIMCAAAGNGDEDDLAGRNNDTTPNYPASYDLPNIISVASTDARDALSAFSHYGSTTVDLAAPGTAILSTALELKLQIGANTYETQSLEFAGQTQALSGKIYNCGIGNQADFPAGVRGNIALIERGTLTFAQKVTFAQLAGAKAAIIYNNASGIFDGTLGSDSSWIPSLAISREDGLAIRALTLPATANLTLVASYRSINGTSMATPHVAGAVAFAAMNFPDETLTQRIQRILTNVDVKSGLQGKLITGGRLNLNRIVDSDQDGKGDWKASFLKITNGPTLKGGVIGLPYAETLVSTGVTGPFTFTVTGGSLPPDITLSSSGQLAGTPSTAGTYTFTVTTADADENGGSKTLTLVVATESPQTVDNILTEGSTGAPYSMALSGSGGTAPYTWTVSAGTLPQGFSLSRSGVLTGLSMTVVTSTFTVKIQDAYQLVNEKEVSLTIALSPITITNPVNLPYGMRLENYQQSLQAEGGAAPYSWTTSSGILPPGLQLLSDGTLKGKPTMLGMYAFRTQVTDDNGLVTSKDFSLLISSVYLKPVIKALVLDSTFVGANYTGAVFAEKYPKSYSIKGLPSGLTYSTKTGIITGRPKVSGDFTITATATNSGGKSDEFTRVLSVRALDDEWIGTFTGIIDRDTTANRNLGSRLTLTTTKLGSFSVKVTTGGTTKAATGFLSESGAQIAVTIDAQPLTLYLDADESTQLLTGTHGGATVNGWRISWSSKTKPATYRMGYYSASLKLANAEDKVLVPQGTGYLTMNISVAGVASISGRTAAGDKFVSSSGLGPNGETATYQSLYKHKGSLMGSFVVDQKSEEPMTDNTLTGSFSWLKPLDTSRTYGAGFGPVTLDLAGGYLAPKASGSVVQNIPTTGDAALKFTEGGLGLAYLNPSIAAFTFSNVYKVGMPTSGGPLNLTRTTLSINKSSGLVSGGFTLQEQSSTVKRTASFLGVIVPQTSGDLKAQGYFLLPQIPVGTQKATTSPILSGAVEITQP